LPIETIGLSKRVLNILRREGVTSIGEVLEMVERGVDAFISIRGFGERSLDDLLSNLRDSGYLLTEANSAKGTVQLPQIKWAEIPEGNVISPQGEEITIGLPPV
ncbi:MAG: hypothetical protein JNJ78_24000, partial [Anaerolineae bacterium]|nr:hypothetical protein [Anaerolineae bacterium]